MKSLVGLAFLASLLVVVGAASARQPAEGADAFAGAAAANSKTTGRQRRLRPCVEPHCGRHAERAPGRRGSRAAAQVSMGMVAGAVYDAVNAITPRTSGRTCSIDASGTPPPPMPRSQPPPTTS